MKALKSAIASFIATVMLSASGIALAADSDIVENEDNSVVVTDTQTDNDADGVGSAVENDSETSDDSQPAGSGEETSSDSESVDDYTQAVTTGECVTRDTDTFSRVVCPDTAKSATKDDADVVPTAPKVTVPTSNTQSQSSPAARVRVTRNTLAPIANNDVTNGVETVDNPQTEKPALPVTGTQTTVKRTDKDGTKDTASAALVTNNEVNGASSRAGLFALVACVAFAVVAAGSFIGVNRLRQ